MEKLPEDFKKKWVEALRSGKYQQGKYYLKDGDTYCCLGVAGVVNGCVAELMEFKGSTFDEIYKEVTPIPLDYYTIGRLTGMNDGTSGDPKSFSEIADYIEQNL